MKQKHSSVWITKMIIFLVSVVLVSEMFDFLFVHCK